MIFTRKNGWKTLVDDRFAALREVIAGRTDGGQSGSGTMQIASLLTMLNEYYTQLTIADSALAAGTLPARITAADKLQLEAAKLPRAAEKHPAGSDEAGNAKNQRRDRRCAEHSDGGDDGRRLP